MPKNIVLLSDGTGNSAGKFFKTNVWRLYQALDLSRTDAEGRPSQIAYYDDGVGTSAFKPLALLGGAFGWGLKRNVLDLYTYLCRNNEAEDRIFGFGFSRGAFTIRVLAGLVSRQGLVKAGSETDQRRLATEAYREYRRKAKYRTLFRLEAPGRLARDVAHQVVSFRKAGPTRTISNPEIAFLGLWDTVAAYGLPFDELTRAWGWVFPLSVPDREPRPNVRRACHALALDDERNTFHPVLWNEENLAPQAAAANIRQEAVTQVWFAGMHAGVGGGYPDDALANVSLEWMLREAQAAGVRFRSEALKQVEEASDVHGRLYDSRQGVAGAYRYLPRKLALLTNDTDDAQNRVVIARPKIHESVLQRIRNGADAYAPIVLPARYAVVDAAGAIHELPESGAAAGIAESRQQAEERARLQEGVWDLVWWRRVAYFSAVFVAGALLFFPLLWPALATCESKWCGMSWVVRAAGALLPAAAAPWFDAYETHPLELGTLVIALGLLLVVGGRLRLGICDRMRALWARAPGAASPAPGGWLYRLRTSRPYVALWKGMKWGVLPAVAGIASGYLLLAAASQALFALINSSGAICASSVAPAKAAASLEGARFDTSAVCWASGFHVQSGVRYRVTLKVDEPWRDGGIAAGLHGIGQREATGMMHLALPFRRLLAEPWFKPIARIGAPGNDQYPLEASEALNLDATGSTLVAEFTARRDGELFLFVNDVAWPLPASLQGHYRNNAGSASVSVTPRGLRGSRPVRAM